MLDSLDTTHTPWLEWWVFIDLLLDVMWVQGTILEMREQMHWVNACQNWHNSHTLIWVVSVCILMCYLCVMCDVWVSTGNDIGDEGTKALSQCLSHLTHLTHLNLHGECVHLDVLLDVICNVWCLMCDVWYVMCDVCEYREHHWRWGNKCTESVLTILDTTHIP